MECKGKTPYRVKLGYVADSPSSIKLVDNYGTQVFDLLPVIQGGETDTSIELIADTRRIRYYPEEYTRTLGKKGCYYDICIQDIAALMDLNELRNVVSAAPQTGETIMFNGSTGQYEMFDLSGALSDIAGDISAVNQRIDALDRRVTNLNASLTQQIARINQLFENITRIDNAISALTDRVAAIENAIYNWATDKTTKIPRGTINVTSGGYNADTGIFSRAKDQNDDLNFE